MSTAMSALIARGLPSIDPAGDYYKLKDLADTNRLRNLQIQQQQQLYPLKLQEAQQQQQIRQTELDKAQRQQRSQQRIQEISQDPTLEGNPDKILTKLIADPNIDPDTYWAYAGNVTKAHADRIAQAKSAADLAKAHQEHNAGLAFGVAQNGFAPAAFGGYLHQAVTDGSMTEEQAKEIERQHREAPEPDAFVKQHILGKMGTTATPVYNAAQEMTLKQAAEKKAARTAEAIQASYALQNDDDVKAWKTQFPEFKNIIGDPFKSDTARLIQMRLAVPPKDQPAYEEKQSEVDWLKDPDRLPKLKAQIDSVIPPSKGPIYAYENNMATQAVGAARNQKDAQAAIKDSADRIGRYLTAQATAAPQREATQDNREFQNGQRSYQFHAGELDRLGKPIADLTGRFGRLQDTLAAGTPQADALVAPELLSVMAGGQGSGLRMNEAEIARLVGGRSKWESLKAAINQWSLDPSKANSITTEQRQEIRALTSEVGRKIQAKQALVDDARRSLAGSNDPMEHRRIIANLNTSLSAIDAGPGSSKEDLTKVPTDELLRRLK